MRLLTAAQVANMLSVSPERIYDLAKQGVLPCVVRVGRQVRFDEEALLAWAKGGGTPLAGGWRRKA